MFSESVAFTLFTYKIFLPLIIVVGLLGNILSIIVLIRAKFQSSVMYTYLRCLAWADIGYLIFTAQVCAFVDSNR